MAPQFSRWDSLCKENRVILKCITTPPPLPPTTNEQELGPGKPKVCQGTIMSCKGREVVEKGSQVHAKRSWGLLNQPYQCSISVSTPAKSRKNKESKIQVNKLIGDLHKQLLQQGKTKVILAFFLSLLLFELPDPNTPWKCQCYMQEFKELSLLIPLRKKEELCKYPLPSSVQSGRQHTWLLQILVCYPASEKAVMLQKSEGQAQKEPS